MADRRESQLSGGRREPASILRRVFFVMVRSVLRTERWFSNLASSPKIGVQFRYYSSMISGNGNTRQWIYMEWECADRVGRDFSCCWFEPAIECCGKRLRASQRVLRSFKFCFRVSRAARSGLARCTAYLSRKAEQNGRVER
jgi:hypothetical protein